MMEQTLLADQQMRMLVDPSTGQIYQVPISAMGDATIIPRHHVSLTQLKCLLRCGKEYEYRYVHRIRTPSKPNLVLGSVYHDTLNKYFGLVLQGVRMRADDAVDHFDDLWTQKLQKEEIEWNPKDEEAEEVRKPDEWKDLGAKLVSVYVTEIAGDVNPLLVEEPFLVPLPGTYYHVSGRIDLVTEGNTIIDHKVSKRKMSDKDAARDLQASMYSWKYFAEDRRRSRPVLFEFHCATDTKTPKVDIVPTSRTLVDAAIVESVLRSNILRLESGIFAPDPTSFLCAKGVCGYYDRCMADLSRSFCVLAP